VSSLTGLVNVLSGAADPGRVEEGLDNSRAPSDPADLMDKIRDDYVVNNYLWTGDIHVPAFERDCRFADPTLSFEGVDTFVTNVRNLRPIVDFLAGAGELRSDLLEISLNEEEGYVKSRWNMVGKLERLPWRPRIDVIGRTKFWYRAKGGLEMEVGNDGGQDVSGYEGGVRVFFYDEEWEIPAGKALLQLITPAGTIENTIK